MTRKKKVKVFLIVIVALYLLSASYGLRQEDDEMGKVMQEIDRMVTDARQEIADEMDKPFILRIFGSLFSMEGNTLDELKEKLPRMLKEAMPKSLASLGKESPNPGIACTGMDLADALLCLERKDVQLEEVFWSYDDRLEENRLQPGGTVLEAVKLETGRGRLTLQLAHPFDGEEGLGNTQEERAAALEWMVEEVAASKGEVLCLDSWLRREDAEKLEAIAENFSLGSWAGEIVPHVSVGSGQE